jgi:hypothetical protein
MRRSPPPTPAGSYLLEIVTPRTNAALISPAENLFSALQAGSTDGQPVALEIAAEGDRRRFLVRCRSQAEQRRVAALIGAAYPQAALRLLGEDSPVDPLALAADERCVCCTLRLRRPEYLPLRTFQDRDLDADAGPAQTDPVLGILMGLGDLAGAWRAVAQLVVLAPAPLHWARAYQRQALEQTIQADRATAGSSSGSILGSLLLVALMGALLVASAASNAWVRQDWGTLAMLTTGSILAVLVGTLLAWWLRRDQLYDSRLVQDKLSRDACLVELRLVIVAPLEADSDAMRAHLRRLAAAYQALSLASGNGLVPASPSDGGQEPLRRLEPLAGWRKRPLLLNVRELACLWHLPQAADDVALVERTTARRRLPLPATVGAGQDSEGCRIGVAAHQLREVPVCLPPALLRRHLLAVAKTRRGKSTLLLRLAAFLMGARADRQCLVLVDPHRDLAKAALGLVPADREAEVVYLDLAERRRPFGLNLLDAGLGWDRDQAVSNSLRIFRREFDGFWGPRMEDAFRFALMALFEANASLCREDRSRGRDWQHTVLDVPALLQLRGFRRRVLKRAADRTIVDWFDTYFEALDPRLRLEVINPVLTKVHRYLGSTVARRIVGQPRSTVDFREFVAQGRLVLVNLSAFDVGEDTAALVGGTLLNLAARAVSAQVVLPPAKRRAVTLCVDEFHTIPGADYEQVFGELAKYGANMILATQTLARLDRLTAADRGRDLRSVVFANLDGLFAFQTSAEDAGFLASELGGGLDEQDVLELGHYQSYARLTDMRTGERLPAFSVLLDPPAAGDAGRAERLARVSAERYGRDWVGVDLALEAAAERIRKRPATSLATDELPESAPPSDGDGVPRPDQTVYGGELPVDAESGAA